MKKWSSVILVLALVSAPSFVPAQPAATVSETTVSEASCCCCSSEEKHDGTATCECDGCTQKERETCRCAPTAPGLAALCLQGGIPIPLSFTRRIFFKDILYTSRTDSPLLRPPIAV